MWSYSNVVVKHVTEQAKERHQVCNFSFQCQSHRLLFNEKFLGSDCGCSRYVVAAFDM